MSGNFDHLSNRELADKLAGYNLYGTTRSSEIPGPVLLKLIQARLRASEPQTQAPATYPEYSGEDRVLSPIGERLIEKE